MMARKPRAKIAITATEISFFIVDSPFQRCLAAGLSPAAGSG